MDEETAKMSINRSPRASLGNDEADQAGSCCFKPQFLTYPELLDKTVSAGLDLGTYSRDEALAIFKRYGYYHLRGFWVSLQDSDGFKHGSRLNDVLAVASLNNALSSWILRTIAPIEIYLRSELSQTLATIKGPFALEYPELFKSNEFYCQMSETLSRELKQGLSAKSPLIQANLSKYGKLPIWAAMEFTSLGTASKIYRNIQDSQTAKSIARDFGTSPRYLENWLRCITSIRNMCAHQDRIYNRMFPTRPLLYKEYAGIDRMRLFPHIIVILRLHDVVASDCTGTVRLQLKHIFDEHPAVDLAPIGFPENWQEILNIPVRAATDSRARGRSGGRPQKDASAVENALFLYDMKHDSIAEICRKTGVGTTTLYKYIHLREEENRQG